MSVGIVAQGLACSSLLSPHHPAPAPTFKVKMVFGYWVRPGSPLGPGLSDPFTGPLPVPRPVL